MFERTVSARWLLTLAALAGIGALLVGLAVAQSAMAQSTALVRPAVQTTVDTAPANPIRTADLKASDLDAAQAQLVQWRRGWRGWGWYGPPVRARYQTFLYPTARAYWWGAPVAGPRVVVGPRVVARPPARWWW
jgi:hypothetical protein